MREPDNDASDSNNVDSLGKMNWDSFRGFPDPGFIPAVYCAICKDNHPWGRCPLQPNDPAVFHDLMRGPNDCF